jgi:hypothetical protein
MKIISDKPLRVATLGGTVVLFEAGVMREIADEVGILAIQMGAKEYNDKYVEEAEAEIADFEEVEEVEEPKTDEALIEVLQKLMELGNPEDFKADGSPKAAVVNRAVGRTVRSEEREEAWEIALNS